MTSDPDGGDGKGSAGSRGDRFGIRQMMWLVAGIAISLWVLRPILVAQYDGEDGDPLTIVPVFLRVVIAVLGGVSFVGVPLLLVRRLRDRRRWGPGQSAWFAHGMSSWLLWPPIIAWQSTGRNDMPWSSVCWLWGTPLMSVYITASLLAGGWLSRRRRGRRRSWSERFGLLLACLWACTGLYLIVLLYSVDVFRKP